MLTCSPSQVTRPGDLKNVCLVSKHLREIALPYLYETVSVTLGSSKDLRMCGLISSSNPGLQHIRYLEVGEIYYHSTSSYHSCSIEEGGYSEAFEGYKQQAQVMIRLLIDHLPKDTIKSFE